MAQPYSKDQEMKRAILLLISLFFAQTSFGYTSEQNRNETYPLHLGVAAVGADASTIFGGNVYGGVFFGSDVFVAGELGQSQWQFQGSEEGVEFDTDATYTSEGAFFRWFIGNSFNLKFGGKISHWSAPMTVSRDYSGTRLQANGTVSTDLGGINLALGNHWMFDSGISIGIDWLSFQVPLFYNETISISNQDVGYLDAEKDLGRGGELLNIMSSFPIGGFILSISIPY